MAEVCLILFIFVCIYSWLTDNSDNNKGTENNESTFQEPSVYDDVGVINTSPGHIEIEPEEDLFLFKSCYIEGDTAYLNYLSDGCIKIECRTGSYYELNNAKHTESVKVRRGTVQHGFVNTIVVFYQLASGQNGFSSIENVLNTFPHQANNEFKRFNIRMNMTQSSLTFTHNGRPASLEDVAHILVNDTQSYNQRVHRSLSLTEGWDVVVNTIERRNSDDYGYIIPENTTNFGATAYICPSCQEHLSKILLPKNTVIQIDGDRCIKLAGCKSVKIDKAFACKYCNLFLASFPNEKLSSGRSLRLKVNNSRFNEIVQMMDDNYRLPDSY